MNGMEYDKSEIKSSNDKYDDKLFIISDYINLDIVKHDIFLYISLLLTCYFLYLKMTNQFMALWYVTFYPIYLYLIIRLLSTFYLIIKNDISENNSKDELNNELLNNIKFRNIYAVSNLFKFIVYLLFIGFIYNVHSFLDTRNDSYLFYSLYFLVYIFIASIFFSLLSKFLISTIPIRKSSLKNDSSYLGFFSSLFAPLLTYLSNLTIICSGGVCTQVYMSTITSLLGAFGVSISNLSKFMFPITCIMLGVSLFSLYIKRKKLLHKPFLLGTVGAIVIIVGKIKEKTPLGKLIYLGNLLMIIAAIWNVKINKMYGLPSHKK